MQKTDSTAKVFGLLCSVFFCWGALTTLNDLLAPQLKQHFTLNYAEMMLLQFCFFLSYFLFSMPFAYLLKKWGYRRHLLVGLSITALGCLALILADMSPWYVVYLAAVFILAAGIVSLQVTCNPLVDLISAAGKSASRLTFAQALNSLGTTISPLLFGAVVMAGWVKTPYVIFIVILVVIILVAAKMITPTTLPSTATARETPAIAAKQLLRHNRLFLLGVTAIFVYVGVEVSTGTLLISYLNLPTIANFPRTLAAHYLAFFWGGALVGRFIGSYLLRWVNVATLIAIHGAIAAILVLSGVFAHGLLAMWSLLSLGLFNSILFPSIFSRTLEAVSTAQKSQASGYLCMAIVGGAIIPELQGILADSVGLQASFLLLFFGYGFILFYGIVARYSKIS